MASPNPWEPERRPKGTITDAAKHRPRSGGGARTFHHAHRPMKVGAAPAKLGDVLDYMDRQGVHSENPHGAEVSGGMDRKELAEAIRAVDREATVRQGRTAEKVALSGVLWLPPEATAEQRQAAAKAVERHLRDELGVAVGWTIHRPPGRQEAPEKANWHLHWVATARPVTRGEDGAWRVQRAPAQSLWGQTVPGGGERLAPIERRVWQRKALRQAVAEAVNGAVPEAGYDPRRKWEITDGRERGRKREPQWSFDRGVDELPRLAPSAEAYERVWHIRAWNRAIDDGRDPAEDAKVQAAQARLAEQRRQAREAAEERRREKARRKAEREKPVADAWREAAGQPEGAVPVPRLAPARGPDLRAAARPEPPREAAKRILTTATGEDDLDRRLDGAGLRREKNRRAAGWRIRDAGGELDATVSELTGGRGLESQLRQNADAAASQSHEPPQRPQPPARPDQAPVADNTAEIVRARQIAQSEGWHQGYRRGQAEAGTGVTLGGKPATAQQIIDRISRDHATIRDLRQALDAQPTPPTPPSEKQARAATDMARRMGMTELAELAASDGRVAGALLGWAQRRQRECQEAAQRPQSAQDGQGQAEGRRDAQKPPQSPKRRPPGRGGGMGD